MMVVVCEDEEKGRGGNCEETDAGTVGKESR